MAKNDNQSKSRSPKKPAVTSKQLKALLAKCAADRDDTDALRRFLEALADCPLYVPCKMHITEEASAVMKRLEEEGVSSEDMAEEDRRAIIDGLIPIPMDVTIDGSRLVPVYTDKKEVVILPEDHDLVELGLGYVYGYVKDTDGVDGVVFNRETDCFTLFVNKEPQDAQTVPDMPGRQPAHTDVSDSGLGIGVDRMEVFNFALYTNGILPVRGIQILNRTGEPARGLTLRISSSYAFFDTFEQALPDIPEGRPVRLPDPALVVRGGVLAGLTESVNASVTVELVSEGERVCGVTEQMLVLAYDQWMGGEGYAELLPAFVMPNHPVIPILRNDARTVLASWGKPVSAEGYQSNDPNRVRELAAAAYGAVQAKNIGYSENPSGFTVLGQRIRTPETVMDQRTGTCMDMTLLYAALLEDMGLHPLLVLVKGHIFAGVWLRNRTPEELRSAPVVIDDLNYLTSRVGNRSDEFTFVECTAMCAGKDVTFEQAEMSARAALLGVEFDCAIDVFLSRLHGVKSIPARTKSGYKIAADDRDLTQVTPPPAELDITLAEPAAAGPRRITGKKELWESKLLDLSSRNMLLHLPLNASVEPIMSSHIDELEDALSDGHEFNLLSAPDWVTDLMMTLRDADGKEGKSVHWLSEALKRFGCYELTTWPANTDFDINERFRREYHNHRLYTFRSPAELDRSLTGIYRSARASQQENGVSSLYLAIGVLRWLAEPDSQEPFYAPLILMPIEIVRKSANQGYALHARAEEPHFNLTLLELLRQNYRLDIPGVEPLPADEHGTDIRRVFAMVRKAVATLPGWDVCETCVIGNFSFAKFAMWNDIHTAGDMLEGSNVVRSLMKGHVDWTLTPASEAEGRHVFLPVSVDDTQLQAVKMADCGMTFVLHGPPGTGKSQTITAMIANLMAKGKKVLFVAEKKAALSVVQKRLAALGIDPFCLELHSDKANKKQVLEQLGNALAIDRPAERSDYEQRLKRAAESRRRIDGYAEHLHRIRTCGKSLRELIALYETVRDNGSAVTFDSDAAGQLTESVIRTHPSLIGQLAAAGEAVGGIAGSPLRGVGLTAYSAEVRSSLPGAASAYRSSLQALKDCAGAGPAGFEAPRDPDELSRYAAMRALCREIKAAGPQLMALLTADRDAVAACLDKTEKIRAEKEQLLEDWTADFLTMDMQPLLTKHEAAAKKFFGKQGAMNQVTAEVRAYSKKQIGYEDIPARLWKIDAWQKNDAEARRALEALSADARAVAEAWPDRRSLEAAYASAADIAERAKAFPGGLEAAYALAGDDARYAALEALGDLAEGFERDKKAFDELLARPAAEYGEDWADRETALCDYLLERPAALKDWGLYNSVRQKCAEAGLEPVAEAYEQGMPAGELEQAYRKGFYLALINHIIAGDDLLSNFSGPTFNEAIVQFKKIDDYMLQLTKKEIYLRLASRLPGAAVSPEEGQELNLLRKAIGSNARGISIRSLFERIPHILPRLTPCMLMSPDSVAQYLAQKNDLFDVVIFDEASQIPTCKAAGALARASAAVIVGDPKQMPPTAFFSGEGPETDDLALDDLDSILEDALALGIPSQYLQWHYRSSHESLIAFSNSRFYDNRMYTFPSANDMERRVTAVFVEGLYANNTNRKEAEAVVAEIVRRFHDPALRDHSIGVVTFNMKQQNLIENLLAKQFQTDPELDAWANNGEDPLFVKNLENVQGDERDVILFSVGYGPDEKGRVSNNFGPINMQGGGKRLNVAFSRARMAMTVFTSMHSTDIRVSESSPDGVVAFRDFLRYAEGHELYAEDPEAAAERLARAGIMQNICKAVEEYGFRTATMVGHSDFHVDIAVVDPCEPSRYLMGIMLDGEGYRQTSNTRDREVSQLSVLRRLGWKLLRVWTIDWWDNRDREIARLKRALDKLSADSRARSEKRKAEEAARQAEEAAREAENQQLRSQLEAQADQVMAEDAAAEDAARTEPETAPVREVIASGTETTVTVNPGETVKIEIDLNGGGGAEKGKAEEPAPQTQAEKAMPWEEAAPETQPDQAEDAAASAEEGAAGAEAGQEEEEPATVTPAGETMPWEEAAPETQPDQAEDAAASAEEESDAGGEAGQVEEAAAQEAEAEAGDGQQEADTPGEAGESGSAWEPEEPSEYVYAELENTPLGIAGFSEPSNKALIADRIAAVVNAEAPILKDAVMRKVFGSFGVQKGAASLEVFEKAFRASGVRARKQKGIIYCWKEDQDPKTYAAIRVSNERPGEEICQQEIRNAVCYALKHHGVMERDDLIKEVSLIFGYKRLGEKLRAALAAGLQWARNSDAIVSAGPNKFALPDKDEGEH